MTAIVLASTVQRAIGLVVAWIVIVGFGVYIFANIRKAKPELGHEVESAPNRKPYYSDEELEGPWLAEPGRQESAIKRFDAIFASRGETLFNTNCAGCHGRGAVGGVAPYVLQSKSGTFVSNVTWKAPALNNVLLRYTRDEVQYVLDHGRAFSPMQPWSTVGGGAMNTQQIQNLIDYLGSVVISKGDAEVQVREGLVARDGRGEAQGDLRGRQEDVCRHDLEHRGVDQARRCEQRVVRPAQARPVDVQQRGRCWLVLLRSLPHTRVVL